MANFIFMLTTQINYATMLKLLLKTANKHLTKLMKKDPKQLEFASNSLIDWNKKMFPDPVFLGHNDLLSYYGSLLNWRKILKWTEFGLVRTKKVKYLKGTNNTYYNENNLEHLEKGFDYKDHYSRDDFAILIERDRILKQNKIKIRELETKDGKLGLYRDFRKNFPDLKEIENLSDSLGTFIGYLAQKKLEQSIQNENFTPEEVIKFQSFLESIIPPLED